MKIRFYAHASFLLEGDGVRVVTDPYRPGKRGSFFEPIHEPADLVIRSSASDAFHNDPSHVHGNPQVIDALRIPRDGQRFRGLELEGYPAWERIRWLPLLLGRLPRRYAMYTLSFPGEGLRLLHGGDMGGPFAPEVVEELAGTIDVLFAITGGVHNIELDDLDEVIRQIRPRIVIPMHYHNPRGRLKTILPVTAFTGRYPVESVVRVGGPDVEITRDSLPETMKIYVLEQCR